MTAAPDLIEPVVGYRLWQIRPNGMRRAKIPREMLDYRRFSTFLANRNSNLTDELQKRLQLTNDDLAG